METQTTTRNKLKTSLPTVAIIAVIGLGGLFLTAHSVVFLAPPEGGGSGNVAPAPFRPADITDAATNVRSQPFGTFSLLPEQWGNRSALIFSRSGVTLGHLTTGPEHDYVDGQRAGEGAATPLRVVVDAGGGIPYSQHVTIFSEGAVKVLCLPVSPAGAEYFYDTRGNPYADEQLRVRTLSFDCLDRASSSLVADGLIDGDAASFPLFRPHSGPQLTSSYLAFARTNPWQWFDLGCISHAGDWVENGHGRLGDIPGCLQAYPPSPYGVSPMYVEPHNSGITVTYEPNILFTWDVAGRVQSYCLPETRVEAANPVDPTTQEILYYAKDGSPYSDPFFEHPLLPHACTEYLSQGFKPADVLSASSSGIPNRGTIAITRGRVRGDFSSDTPKMFGMLDSNGRWHDGGLGGAGSSPVREDSPLGIFMINEGDTPLVFNQTNLQLTTESGTVSVCLPRTEVPPYPNRVKSFFVDHSLQVFHDPLFLVPALCEQRKPNPKQVIEESR